MHLALKLGLTGGIGSGKSTVANLFAALGASVVDADQISRATTANNGAAMAQIGAEFGAKFVKPDQSLDRDAMRELAFTDASARKRLEAIVHPLVGAEIARQSQMAVLRRSPCIIYDIPLLAESSHWRSRVDQILVVDCPEAVQVQRVVTRSGLQAREVEGIIAAQAPRTTRLQLADLVIFNGGSSMEALRADVAQLWQGLRLSSANLPDSKQTGIPA